MEAGKVLKRGEDLFFFAFHFWKQRKFVLGLPKWEFSTGKKHFTSGKKSGKMTLPPQKNMPVTPLLCGALRIAHRMVSNIRRCIRRDAVPTDDYQGKKANGLYLFDHSFPLYDLLYLSNHYTVKNYSVFYSVLLLNCYSEWLFPQFTVNCCYFYIYFCQILCFFTV